MMPVDTALLILEDGTIFHGTPYAQRGRSSGVLCGTTAAFGYQELLTSQDVTGKIVLFTTPHIGNTGVLDLGEDSQYTAAGVIIRDPIARGSHYQKTGELEEALKNAGVVGIQQVDTRAIMRKIRDTPQTATILSGEDAHNYLVVHS
ncbi:carbamoyl-phosphate synthase domain-containing protein [Actinotignum urinale]|uniref:Carbamoyl-phosphate synthase domain-containing protein n=1 Tax=Actinotignum urinale TaxID=190146 RepID=A0AAW9HS43_9ACTO|nr:carbamoyl-phosphate synthase domain-containing protein [Actinotignum urinale]MDY5154483.1 carbamoyl-phosphate synthase domain-containing protein [Actinotignum urinale]MDY5160317.1 carbamoyl-phosphate synthase domain-containing protein [Actinotignum urinale]WIK59018.1 carbamoyl-phosphate synthase domain-containing protein [Actinotignum urinale]